MLQSYFPIHKTYFSFLMHHWNWHFFSLSLTPLRCRIIFWGFWHFSRIEQWTPNASVAFFSYYCCTIARSHMMRNRNVREREMVGWWQKSHLKLNKLFWNLGPTVATKTANFKRNCQFLWIFVLKRDEIRGVGCKVSFFKKYHDRMENFQDFLLSNGKIIIFKMRFHTPHP